MDALRVVTNGESVMSQSHLQVPTYFIVEHGTCKLFTVAAHLITYLFTNGAATR